MIDSASPRASSLPRLVSAAACVLSMLTFAAAPAAFAAACGDNVDGERVPCACGDNVISDTVLWPTDPVVSQPCSDDGLVVLVPSGSDGITLNLGGQSLLGTGHGAGIRVVRGGLLGSIIVGGDVGDTRAEIARFDTGIRASGRNVLRQVKAIDIHNNNDDGLRIRTSGVLVEDVRTDSNGRHGASVSGHGNDIDGVVAQDNVRDGLQVRGTGTSINAETNGNRHNGTVIGGRGNHVKTVQSDNNGGAGVVATGSGHEVAELSAVNNGGGELSGRPGATK